MLSSSALLLVSNSLIFRHLEISEFARTSRICPPSQLLAEAVPEDEEDYPRFLRRPVIRNQFKGSACGAGVVGMSFEKSPCDLQKFTMGGCGSLHARDVFHLRDAARCLSFYYLQCNELYLCILTLQQSLASPILGAIRFTPG